MAFNLIKGIKTTFHIKDLTPQQKEEIAKKKKEEQAYKQILEERKKAAYQEAYQKELAHQRQLYVQRQEKESMARAMSRAKQEVEAMSKPKQKLSWLSAPANIINKYLPPPPAKVQKQLTASLSALSKQSPPKVKPHLKSLGTPQGGIDVDLMGTQVVMNKKTKSKKKKDELNSMFWRL